MRLLVGIDLLRKIVMLATDLTEDRLTRELIFWNGSIGHDFAEVTALYAAHDLPSPHSQQAEEIKILQQRQWGKGHNLIFVLFASGQRVLEEGSNESLIFCMVGKSASLNTKHFYRNVPLITSSTSMELLHKIWNVTQKLFITIGYCAP